MQQINAEQDKTYANADENAHEETKRPEMIKSASEKKIIVT
jgi:hypothetical protein